MTEMKNECRELSDSNGSLPSAEHIDGIVEKLRGSLLVFEQSNSLCELAKKLIIEYCEESTKHRQP